MAHQINSMMYAGAAPWHGLGTKVEGILSVAEVIKAAGLDWTVGKFKVFTEDGVAVPGVHAVRRSDTMEVIGTVGDRYSFVQNESAFIPFQGFADQGLVSFETAGALGVGERVWILAKINRPNSVIVPQADDSVAKYMLLSNSHDGSMSVRVGFTPIRVVCNNTLRLAHADGASKLIRINHRGNMESKLEALTETINVVDQSFEATADKYRALASKGINSADLENLVKIVFSQRESDSKKKSPVLEKIIPLFEHGRGNDLPGVRGTLWAAYNAITEYIQYERGDDANRRLDSTWFGTGQQLNARALDAALELIKA